MKVDVFEFTDYKKLLKAMLAEKPVQRGRLSRFAEAAGCQPSFLSQVIHGTTHITPDQASGISLHLNLSEDETDYFMGLVDRERCATRHLKDRIDRRLEILRKKGKTISSHLRIKPLEDESSRLFATNWLFTALRILVSIPKYQDEAAIANRLGLDEKTIREGLMHLQEQGYVVRVETKWKRTDRRIHISGESPYIGVYHQAWRTRAVLDAQTQNEKSVHFTSLISLSHRDAGRLRELLLQFIKDADELSEVSTEEEAFVLICDLFKI